MSDQVYPLESYYLTVIFGMEIENKGEMQSQKDSGNTYTLKFFFVEHITNKRK